MDDQAVDSICEIDEKCERCKKIHICQRCTKNFHVCSHCGKMSYNCDICGSTADSLAELKKHQKESKICRKAKTLTGVSLKEQLQKCGYHIQNKPVHNRSAILNPNKLGFSPSVGLRF